jgi:hypothetical protein
VVCGNNSIFGIVESSARWNESVSYLVVFTRGFSGECGTLWAKFHLDGISKAVTA